MPKTTSSGRVKKREPPSTLQHSPAKAQRTFANARASSARRANG